MLNVPPAFYSRSDCSGVRTRTVTFVESVCPAASVTVSMNLYIPELRLDTMIWSGKLVLCRNTTHLSRGTEPTGADRADSHLNHGVRASRNHLPVVGLDALVVFALQAVERDVFVGLDHLVRSPVGHRRPVRLVWINTTES